MRRKIIPYKPFLKQYARKLRNKSTKSEIILWKCLKGKQMMGYDFHRQKPLFEYIADFFCHELLLVIEVDGASHESYFIQEKDDIKQKRFEDYGITVLRIPDVDVFTDIDSVLKKIEEYIVAIEAK